MTPMLLALILQAAPAATPDPFAARGRARIERSASLARRSVVIDMVSDFDDRTRRHEQTLRLVSRNLDEPPVTLWASSRTCPTAGEVASFADLPLPRPRPPGAEIDLVMDGVGYSVTLPLSYGRQGGGRATFSSNVGTPLAAWVDAALAKLERCWSTREPSQAARPGFP